MSTGKHGTGGESRETSARKGRKVEDERRRGGSRRQLGGRWLGEDEENEAERGGGGWLSSWLDIAQWRKQKPPKPLSVGVVLLSLSLSLEKNEEKSSAASQALASLGWTAAILPAKRIKLAGRRQEET